MIDGPIVEKEMYLKSEQKDRSLDKYYQKRVLAIPELQRNFVWNATRLRDLADSIFKGYSIGTFTVWNATKKKEDFLRHFQGLLPPYDSENNDRIHYVIDGQQRLIALLGFLKSDGLDITNDSGVEFNSKNICFTVKKDENGLNFSYVKKGADNIKYYSLCDILSDNYKDRYYNIIKTKKFYKIEECRKKFLSYPFIFVYLSKDIKEENLRETFIRLNTRGMSLSSVDRNFAYASKVGLREKFKKIKSELGIFKNLNDSPIQEFIYMIFKGEEHVTRFNALAIGKIFKKINDNSEYTDKFEREWKDYKKAISRSETFLKGQGVQSLKFLPSNTLVPILATFYYYYRKDKINRYLEKQLKKWFWYSSVSGRYSGSGYYYYAIRDVEVMKTLAKGKRKEFEGLESVDIDELDNARYYSDRSSLVKAFYCLLALQEPREFFRWKQKIDLKDPNYRERKENHHIFPEKFVDGIIPPKKYDNICNICFLPKGQNASFLKEAPWKYLNSDKIDTDNIGKILSSHLIPYSVRNQNGSIKDNFYDFYEKRKRIIIKDFEKEAGIKIFE